MQGTGRIRRQPAARDGGQGETIVFVFEILAAEQCPISLFVACGSVSQRFATIGCQRLRVQSLKYPHGCGCHDGSGEQQRYKSIH
jgi:hypothetical protein